MTKRILFITSINMKNIRKRNDGFALCKKYVFNTKDEITKIGHEVKAINDEYMEKIIVSPIPPVVK